MRILGITGHRPVKLGLPYDLEQLLNDSNNKIFNSLMTCIVKYLHDINPGKVITGMALGFDQYVAYACRALSIPYSAYLPFIGQESKWPAASQQIYRNLLEDASEIKIISPGGYASYKMQVRNEAIVDDSDQMLACFNGSLGGTANCVKYAIKKMKPIEYINPKEFV